MDVEALKEMLYQFTAFPDPVLEVAQLTDRDRIALCIAAGVEVDLVREKKNGMVYLRATTRRCCGIVKVDGRFQVVEEKQYPEQYVTVNLSGHEERAQDRKGAMIFHG